jgi:phosphate transport system permease protein
LDEKKSQTQAVPSDEQAINKTTRREKWEDYKRHPFSMFLYILVILAAAITVAVLGYLLVFLFVKGVPNLRWSLFEWNYTRENVSMMPAIINTLTVTALCLLFAVPVGIGSAIYLVEYAKRGSKLVEIVRMTTETLSGIPSIIYGLFGFLLFAVSFKWGYTLLGGALTLAIMVLPVIMRTTEEALKAVPDTYREGSFGLGAGKLRTIFRIILPTAMPGILSGVILAVGRTVGETAALLYTAGTVAGIPSSIMGSGRTLAVHMYVLLSEGLYIDQAYATGVVLIVLVILINGISNRIAKKLGNKLG